METIEWRFFFFVVGWSFSSEVGRMGDLPYHISLVFIPYGFHLSPHNNRMPSVFIFTTITSIIHTSRVCRPMRGAAMLKPDKMKGKVLHCRWKPLRKELSLTESTVFHPVEAPRFTSTIDSEHKCNYGTKFKYLLDVVLRVMTNSSFIQQPQIACRLQSSSGRWMQNKNRIRVSLLQSAAAGFVCVVKWKQYPNILRPTAVRRRNSPQAQPQPHRANIDLLLIGI